MAMATRVTGSELQEIQAVQIKLISSTVFNDCFRIEVRELRTTETVKITLLSVLVLNEPIRPFQFVAVEIEMWGKDMAGGGVITNPQASVTRRLHQPVDF